MIEQVGAGVAFYAFFVASKAGKTGIGVTCDVWRITEAGAATEVVAAGSATEIGDGLYRYGLSAASVTAAGEYIAVFKTADATVDAQHIPAVWAVGRGGIESLDAAISTRLAAAGYTTPPDVAAIVGAIFEELLASYTTPGSAAAYIKAAGAASDPLTSYPEDYDPGTIGNRMRLIGPGLVRAISNVSERGDRLILDAGDSYTGARALEWTDAGDWPELQPGDAASLVVHGQFEADAVIHNAGDAVNQRITCELATTETTALQSGSAIPFAVRVTRPQDDPTPDDVITIIRGAATIRARVSA